MSNPEPPLVDGIVEVLSGLSKDNLARVLERVLPPAPAGPPSTQPVENLGPAVRDTTPANDYPASWARKPRNQKG